MVETLSGVASKGPLIYVQLTTQTLCIKKLLPFQSFVIFLQGNNSIHHFHW